MFETVDIDVSTGFVETSQGFGSVFNNIPEFHDWLKRELERYPGLKVEKLRYNSDGSPHYKLKAWYDKQYVMDGDLSFVVMEVYIYSKVAVLSSLKTGFAERLRQSLMRSKIYNPNKVTEYRKFDKFIVSIQLKIERCVFNYGV